MKSDHPTADAEPAILRHSRDRLKKIGPGYNTVDMGIRSGEVREIIAYIDRLSRKPATVSGEETAFIRHVREQIAKSGPGFSTIVDARIYPAERDDVLALLDRASSPPAKEPSEREADAEPGRWLFENIPWQQSRTETRVPWKGCDAEERVAWAAVESQAIEITRLRVSQLLDADLRKRSGVLRAENARLRSELAEAKREVAEERTKTADSLGSLAPLRAKLTEISARLGLHESVSLTNVLVAVEDALRSHGLIPLSDDVDVFDQCARGSDSDGWGCTKRRGHAGACSSNESLRPAPSQSGNSGEVDEATKEHKCICHDDPVAPVPHPDCEVHTAETKEPTAEGKGGRCDACAGKGWDWVTRDGEQWRGRCDACKGTGQKPEPVATTMTGPSGKDVASQSRSTEGLRLAGSEDCGKGSAATATESVGGDTSARDQESKARHPGEAGHPIPPDDAERECPHGDRCCQSEPCKGPQVTCPHCNSDPAKVDDCRVCEGDGSVLAVQYIRDLALTARGQVATSAVPNPDLP